MLSSPESNLPLPEKEAQALANVRTEILIGEQKVKQLQTAERQLKNEIQADLTNKALIVSVIDTLSKERDILLEKINEAQKEFNALEGDIIHSRNVFVEINREIEEKKASLDQREQEILEKENIIKTQFEQLGDASSKLAEDQKKHEDKVTKLLNALK